jgi:hypothetical protein
MREVKQRLYEVFDEGRNRLTLLPLDCALETRQSCAKKSTYLFLMRGIIIETRDFFSADDRGVSAEQADYNRRLRL